MRHAYQSKSSAVAALASDPDPVHAARAVMNQRVSRSHDGRIAAPDSTRPSGLWDDNPSVTGTSTVAAPPPLTRDLYALLDAVEDPMLLLDGQSRVLFRNQAAASMVDDAAGLRPVSLVHCEGELWRAARELVAQALNGQPCPKRKAMAEQPAKCWEVFLQELPNSTSSARRFALRLHDITEQERLLRELRVNQSLARSGMLLAGAAHQAKNLLFGLSATVQALQASHATDLDQDDPHLRNLRDGIARMEAMVRNVFAQSRARGKDCALWAGVIVGEAIRGCAQLALSRKVNICTGLIADAQVWGEPQPLILAVENLIDNAVRYSPEGATVTVDVARAGGEDNAVNIRIADRGTGFRPEDRDKLFTPFYTRRPGGTGLGLAVARHIVKEHSGQIALSNADTGGAVVTVLLPTLDDSAKSDLNHDGAC